MPADLNLNGPSKEDKWKLMKSIELFKEVKYISVHFGSVGWFFTYVENDPILD